MNFEQVLLVAAVVVFVIARRFAGSPIGARSMLVPIALTIYGISQIHGPVRASDIVLIAVELIISVAGGVVRGYTIKLYVHAGHLWQRYRVTTLLVWIAMIALRVGFAFAGHAEGARIAPGAAMIAFGVSILVESLVVARRAAASGVPMLSRPDRRERRRTSL